MNRNQFLKSLLTSVFTLPMMKIQAFEKTMESLTPTPKMPMMFIGHGNPMNAILDNSFSRTWKDLGKKLPTPQAILVVSAHWITPNKTKVTVMDSPKTIHDFGGFPEKLFQQQYPAPGSPKFAKETIELINKVTVEEDHQWGLDHGTWAVLKPMFPAATVPVYQISLDYNKPASFHYQVGKELNALRNKGVLIIGSGNIVHNLSELQSGVSAYDWATEFDQKITDYIDQRDFNTVVNFQKLGTVAQQAHPTHDHLLPLLHILGATETNDTISYFNDSFDLGSISMRSLLIKE